MVPSAGRWLRLASTAPRTRGDGPKASLQRIRDRHCSPHPRGWSLRRHDPGIQVDLLPAPAGMVPPPATARWAAVPAPRTRGDGPQRAEDRAAFEACSPHPRGWSRGPHLGEDAGHLLPAPAGMVPMTSGWATRARSAPRTRGDGPSALNLAEAFDVCSPHPRGWSLLAMRVQQTERLLPAPAGMVPPPSDWTPLRDPAPRTRGDGPMGPCRVSSRRGCSPHPRGWSLPILPDADGPSLLPAPAGMVPPRPPRSRRTAPAPRTRGDGPGGAASARG